MTEGWRRVGMLFRLTLLGLVVAGCSLAPAEPSLTPASTVTEAPHDTAVPSSVPVQPPTPTPVARPETTAMASAVPAEVRGWEDQTMILTVVYDNNPYDPRLQTGWGFGAWLEYGEQTVLFDTGADGTVLLDNMAALGLDPKAIDVVVLSHAHDDHTGGLFKLLEVNPEVIVYLPQVLSDRFKAQARAAGAVVVGVDAPVEVVPGLWSTGQMGSGAVEQALAVETGKGLVVVTGCAHPGVDEMVARAAEVAGAQQIGGGEIALVVGGFHLGSASRAHIEEIIGNFRRLGVQQVAPCHCTGEAARALFLEAYGDDYHGCGVGWQWQGEVSTWQPAHQGIPAQIGVAAVAVAPGDSRVVYLAAYQPPGLYRSGDGGDSWQAASQGLAGEAPLAVAVHPQDPHSAWVGTVGGGYRTVDGGQNWQPMAGLPNAPIYALAAAPDGRILYAAGEGRGIWHSQDGGQSWAVAGLAEIEVSTLSLAIHTEGALLAGTAGRGVWASHDAGQSWQQAAGELANAHVSTLVIAPGGRSYALADGGLYLSLDGGDTWETIGLPGFGALALGLASPGDRLYLGSKGEGLAVSEEGGGSWMHMGAEFRHADITCLVGDPVTPGRVFLGTRYHGLHRTDDGGASWELVSGGIGQPVIMALAQDPLDAKVFYAGALDGVYRSDDGGGFWRLVSGEMGKLMVQSLAVGPQGERVYAGTDSGIYVSQDRGATWRWAEEDTGGITIFDIVLDPRDPATIYAGSWGHNVLLGTDGGGVWSPIHNGLETLSVHAFAVDPGNPQSLYAGTVEAVYRSTDGGQTWQASLLADRPLTVFALAIDSGEPARVYAGTTDGVYLSVDGGETWQPAGQESLGATVTALALAADEARMLLAGTEHYGLYRSRDGGALWQPWGLDTTSVYTILVDRAGMAWLGTDQGIFRSR
ncbi:MAG: MBL fold metallo-hydrolase [Anaerolineae bacterium]|nr:MBL fold metallo-hydrolase [Anaerolineae bacterium]